MFNKKILLVFIIGLGILISCNSNEESQANNSSTSKEQTETVANESGILGQTAPGFTLENLDGVEVSLEDFEDKTILLNFWATWCPPCRQEIPDLIDLHENQKENGIEVVGVSLDKKKTNKELKQFVSNNEINYPVLKGDQAKLGKLVKKYGGIRGIPTTFLIDKQGKVRHKWVGAKTREQFMSEVKKYK